MATHSQNWKERDSEEAVPGQREALESELSQSLSELSSIDSSTKGKKKGRRRKHQTFETLSFSKSEEVRPISRNSLSSDKQMQSKAVPQPLRGTQANIYLPLIRISHIYLFNLFNRFVRAHVVTVSSIPG